jgi:hypothetical protein
MGLPKALILTPCRDGLYHYTYLNSLIACYREGLIHAHILMNDESDIVRARTRLIQVANDIYEQAHQKQINVKYALFVDADIVFNDEQVRKIINDAERFNLDIVGGVYTHRTPEVKFAYLPFLSCLEQKDECDLIRCVAVGCGFMLVRLPVQLKEDSFHPMYIDYRGENTYLSEDYAFCKKSEKEVWMHRGIRLGHRGNFTYYA